jgi:hypothetical protein
MGTLISAGIAGLFMGAWYLWRQYKAERDAILVERQKDIIAGDKQADLDESSITSGANAARDAAGSDFNQLR